MKIGLWSDCHNFPSLPLMKLSAYHKSLGDAVEHYIPLNHYDLVYASKVFSFTPDIDDTCIVQADEVRRGGTGYCISVENGREVFDSSKDTPLPKEIEHIYPDYDLYPDYKYSVGFLTRGCPRGCGFCIVGSKEGRCSHQVADLSEFWRGQREIKLLDPNLLACKDHEKLLLQLAESGDKFYRYGLERGFNGAIGGSRQRKKEEIMATKEKYINANLLREELEEMVLHGKFACPFDFLFEYIERYAQEDRTPSNARWNPAGRYVVCSSCNAMILNRDPTKTCRLDYNYCPYCGAKMDGDKNERLP